MSNTDTALVAAEIFADNALAEIRINDVPVTTIGRFGSAHAFEPVPAYVVRGQNTLAVRVQAAPDSKPDVTARLLVRIAVFSEGDEYFTGAGTELAMFEWTGREPQIATRGFEASFGPLRWAWSGCTQWSDSQQALANARPFVEALTKAIDQSDADWINQVSGPKFSDMTKAFKAMSEAEMRQLTANLITSSPRFAGRPSQVPQVPVLVADGRLLHVLRPDGVSYFVKPDTDGSAFEPTMYLGRIDNEWRIIR